MVHIVETLQSSSSDIRILWASVFIRLTSYGATNQILTLYLKSLNISESNIGLFMTLSLLGDSAISYNLTWYGDKIGRKNVMIIGTLLMMISGIIFASPIDNFIILLFAAIVGVISPSGDETGPFKSVEEASIAQLAPLDLRPEVYAIHGLLSTMGSAFGSIVTGFMIDYLNRKQGWQLLTCYKSVFVGYTLLAFTKFILMLYLSENCEVTYRSTHCLEQDIQERNTSSSDSDPLLEGLHGSVREYDYEEEDDEMRQDILNTSTWTGLSHQTQNILSKLLVIFMIDSFGYGFMTSAWVVYYFKVSFGVTAFVLGILFFITNISNAITSIPSAIIAKRIGPVKGTLFTQLPSAVFFMLIPLLNFSFVASAISLILYSSMMAMDVVPRQILLTTLINHHELTKVLGIVNIGKTAARCCGPVFTGKLASMGKLWVCYIISGLSVLLSGSILAINFRGIDKVVLQQNRVRRRV